jgi:hypothetical protein
MGALAGSILSSPEALIIRLLDGRWLIGFARPEARPALGLHGAGGLAQHPGEGEKFMLGRLDLERPGAVRQLDVDDTTDLAAIIDYAAPHEFLDAVPAHGNRSLTGRETIILQPSAGNAGGA